ncbi:MAG: nucleotidyltransferase domain-containing protein [Pseudomonadota bacterium]|nr:nucleotidyltransferase domain-containing protein [Pseudomonadota bacterium]MDP1905211.1 nucleotidyltransferase domain-containing protein [Pseudomonadota bacterium]MDP2352773.1 nucleotidyltransferase domain-containing protein [Pseudomonadota bacterium]
MPELDLATLQLPPRYLEMVRRVLRERVPEAEVWAYGSRVNGDSYDASDLDLVVRQPDDLWRETAKWWLLTEAFEEGDLPIQVQIVDWARIPASFRDEIEAAYVVVQHKLDAMT